MQKNVPTQFRLGPSLVPAVAPALTPQAPPSLFPVKAETVRIKNRCRNKCSSKASSAAAAGSDDKDPVQELGQEWSYQSEVDSIRKSTVGMLSHAKLGRRICSPPFICARPVIALRLSLVTGHVSLPCGKVLVRCHGMCLACVRCSRKGDPLVRLTFRTMHEAFFSSSFLKSSSPLIWSYWRYPSVPSTSTHAVAHHKLLFSS